MEQARARAAGGWSTQALLGAQDGWASGEWVGRETKLAAFTLGGALENRARPFAWVRENIVPNEATGVSPGNQATPKPRRELDAGISREFDGGAKAPGSPRGLDFSSAGHQTSALTASDTASWNRYGYAANNPLRYVDPDGRKYVIRDPVTKEVVGEMSEEAFEKWRDEHARGDKGLRFTYYPVEGGKWVGAIYGTDEEGNYSEQTLLYNWEWEKNKAASAEMLLAACVVGVAVDYIEGVKDLRNVGKDLGAVSSSGDAKKIAFASAAEGLRVLEIVGYALLIGRLAQPAFQFAKSAVKKQLLREAEEAIGLAVEKQGVSDLRSGIYRFPDAQNPGRVKSGMATDMKGRLGQHTRSGRLADHAQATVTEVETYGATGRDARRLRALAEQEQREELLRQGEVLSDIYRSVDPRKRQALEALREWYKTGQQGLKPTGY